MSKRLRFLLPGMILICVTALTACNVVARTPLAPAPAPSPVPLPTCIPGINDIYTPKQGFLGDANAAVSKIVDELYVKFLGTNTDNPLMTQQKSQALDFLSYETRRWSHIETVTYQNKETVRLIITFISPELIRAALLNHAMYSVYPEKIQNLNATTQAALETLNKTNRFLFLVVVQPQPGSQSQTPLQILPENMVLQNTRGMEFAKSQNELLLDPGYTFSSAPRAALIFFPAHVFYEKNTCIAVLDPTQDTSIILHIKAVKTGDEARDVKWEFPFVPVLPVNITVPTPNPDLIINPNDFSPLNDITALPVPTEEDAVNQYSGGPSAFWLNYARFVWACLTLDYLSLH